MSEMLSQICEPHDDQIPTLHRRTKKELFYAGKPVWTERPHDTDPNRRIVEFFNEMMLKGHIEEDADLKCLVYTNSDPLATVALDLITPEPIKFQEAVILLQSFRIDV
jgi:hypothetical protein